MVLLRYSFIFCFAKAYHIAYDIPLQIPIMFGWGLGAAAYIYIYIYIYIYNRGAFSQVPGRQAAFPPPRLQWNGSFSLLACVRGLLQVLGDVSSAGFGRLLETILGCPMVSWTEVGELCKRVFEMNAS